MERTPAVAVVFHHIGPYHHARLNAAADKLSVTGIEWSAKGYDAWGPAESAARYQKLSLFPQATEKDPGNVELQRAFRSALERVKPDVVAVNGWNNFGSLIAANCCLRRGIPMIVTYHPAYLLRSLPEKAKAWADLCFAVETMKDLQSRAGAPI